MKLNKAQQMNAEWLGVDADFYNSASAKIATQQTKSVIESHKAPHAMRGTPPRNHYPRKPKMKLFTGHRA